uniref:Uncharacterized protein n=1 Tax=Candidatus Kentrum sp. FW TaxID=2126338 RepID=A0A450TXP9_9GAMM|nr:MAG: hypothetical protein BECKFW1821C_GA0114237_105911 [Candidatus Kentron sp. FW]
MGTSNQERSLGSALIRDMVGNTLCGVPKRLCRSPECHRERPTVWRIIHQIVSIVTMKQQVLFHYPECRNPLHDHCSVIA